MTVELSNQKLYNPATGRFDHIDIAKGILIIAVVLGHSLGDKESQVLYWFHIPAFFFISGMLLTGKNFDTDKLLKRMKMLLIPYLCWGFLISTYNLLINWYFSKTFNIALLGDDLLRLILGGRSLTGNFGVFWFINVLILIHIGFFFLAKMKPYQVISVLFIFYVFSRLLSSRYGDESPRVIWNIDSAMESLIFFSLGYYSNSLIQYFYRHLWGIIMIIAGSLLIWLQLAGIINFNLNMKYMHLDAWAIDLLVPLLFTGIVFYISTLIAHLSVSKGLIYMGMHTQIVMYLHLVSTRFAGIFIKTSNPVLFLTIGIVLPLIALQIIKRSALSSKLFLGRF
jgi:fucose 4-O-acetylase-like acetyltransferase